MASPKVHTGASGMLMVVANVVGFFIGVTLSWLDVLWIVVFGILIDADKVFSVNLIRRHIEAYKSAGFAGIKEFWKQQKWIDENHVNFMHTWWALAGAIIFSYLVSSFWPAVSFAVHMLIDGASRSQLDYPKCSPLPYSLHRFYPEWMKYYTAGIPVPEKK